MIRRALSIALLSLSSATLLACATKDSLPPQGTTDDALGADALALLSCEIHYYDSASLPNTHVLHSAQGYAGTTSLSTTPLTLVSPDGIVGEFAVSDGLLWVSATSGPAATFLASGAYPLTHKRFYTDLQGPMPPIVADGISYDRFWMGCFSVSAAPSVDAGATID